MHNEIVNNTRYNDPTRKPIKQTNFTVKNLGETFPKSNPLQ